MSANLDQVLKEAKNLTNLLKDDETKSDSLLTQTKSIENKIKHMKQYSEDVEILNEAASQRSQSVVVAGLQREGQVLRKLQAENRELRAALEDYENALELIMSKYRQQADQLTRDTRKEISNHFQTAYSQIIMEQSNQINEMKNVMRRALAMDEDETVKDKEMITRLMVENKGLREMCLTFHKYGRQKPEPPAESKLEAAPGDVSLSPNESPSVKS